MMEITYNSNRAPLSGPLAEAAEVEARNAAGEAVIGKLQDHFLARNARPNARNWPKRGFWADVLKTVGSNISRESYAVVVAHAGFWRRWMPGGAIKPKAAKRLAIPAIAEAYVAGTPSAGRVPVALTIIVRRRAGKPPAVALAEITEQPSKRNPDSTVKVPGRIWYWLVQQANPARDPDAIPPIADLQTVAVETADSFMRGITAKLRPAT